MYKDKVKQRKTNRERQRRYRALHKGVTKKGVTEIPVTFSGVIPVTPIKLKRGNTPNVKPELAPGQYKFGSIMPDDYEEPAVEDCLTDEDIPVQHDNPMKVGYEPLR